MHNQIYRKNIPKGFVKALVKVSLMQSGFASILNVI